MLADVYKRQEQQPRRNAQIKPSVGADILYRGKLRSERFTVPDKIFLQILAVLPDGLIIVAKAQVAAISFTHFIELVKIDNPVKRMYYEMLTIQTGLSVRELKRQIGCLLYTSRCV